MPNKKWKQISQFEDSKQSLGFLMWKTQIIWRRQLEKALSQYDLTHPQFVLLASIAYLTQDGDTLTQAELAQHTSCDINTTSQVLRMLERKELITRLNKVGNDKSKYPKLTTHGYNKLKTVVKTVEAIDQEFFSSLTSTQAENFRKSLIKLSDNFS